QLPALGPGARRGWGRELAECDARPAGGGRGVLTVVPRLRRRQQRDQRDRERDDREHRRAGTNRFLVALRESHASEPTGRVTVTAGPIAGCRSGPLALPRRHELADTARTWPGPRRDDV